jgi:hypothetical protein
VNPPFSFVSEGDTGQDDITAKQFDFDPEKAYHKKTGEHRTFRKG